MRSTLPALIAGTAVLLLTAACGTDDPAPVAAPATTPTLAASTPTPTGPPEPVELTKATFAPKVLGALRAAGTFRTTAQFADGSPGLDPTLTADIRLKGSVTDAVVTSDEGLPVRRIGKVLYMENDELTGDPKRPWVKLDLAGKDPNVLAAALVVVQDLNRAMIHQLIGGAAHATKFQDRGVDVRLGVQVRQYSMSFDLKKATAARVFGVYLDETDAKTLLPQFSMSVEVDAQNRPRRVNFHLNDMKGGDVAVEARFGHFGAKLPVVAPPAAKTGKLDLS
ncbi:hypothetical protein [Kribbella sp. DT2]|uniref:hypothetical protein n=1 Tax=Kribbella sp. DT2 TaxID=3393427 RepID=UPI003CE99E5F